MTIGDMIQTLRIQKNLTQEALAEKLEVSRQSVSKWELGQAVPDVDKIVRMSELFGVTTDKLLMRDTDDAQIKKPTLHFASTVLIVSDFKKSLDFYSRLFDLNISNPLRSADRYAEFYIDSKCIAVMSEDNADCVNFSDIKGSRIILNFWAEDLSAEYERIRKLDIGILSEIKDTYPHYHYFHLTDPDNNIIEITGGYHMSAEICQSCGMKMQSSDLGKNADGSTNHEYCKYCFPDGKFSRDLTMDEMIESNLKFLDIFNKEAGTSMTPDQARAGMREAFPGLKRWKK